MVLCGAVGWCVVCGSVVVVALFWGCISDLKYLKNNKMKEEMSHESDGRQPSQVSPGVGPVLPSWLP